MRLSRIPLVAVAAAALFLWACSDQRDLLSPPTSALHGPGGGGVGTNPPPDHLFDITAGGYHTCAMYLSGRIYCWGSDQENEIGVPSTDTCGAQGYGLTPCVPTPTRITGTDVVDGTTYQLTLGTRVTAGEFHTCALAGKDVWCWGVNAEGEVGDGSRTGYPSGASATVATPQRIATGFTAISAGGSTTCGVTSTELWCWGQLHADASTVATPTRFSYIAGWDTIAVGRGDFCGRRSGLWGCFGANGYGQLGLNPGLWPYIDAPDGPIGSVAYNGATNVFSTAGTTCFGAADNTVKCLGSNLHGLLGDDRTLATPSIYTISGTLSKVTIGEDHACALDPSGQAYCWGGNSLGQSGTGTATGTLNLRPVAVTGGHRFTKLSAGTYHTCGLTTDYEIYCWGSNYQGQLGFPNHAPSSINPTPVRVAF